MIRIRTVTQQALRRAVVGACLAVPAFVGFVWLFVIVLGVLL